LFASVEAIARRAAFGFRKHREQLSRASPPGSIRRSTVRRADLLQYKVSIGRVCGDNEFKQYVAPIVRGNALLNQGDQSGVIRLESAHGRQGEWWSKGSCAQLCEDG
jgi:hypothetical protein